MIEALIEIIFSANKLISEQLVPDQEESTRLIVSCIKELEEIDEKICQHFQEEI